MINEVQLITTRSDPFDPRKMRRSNDLNKIRIKEAENNLLAYIINEGYSKYLPTFIRATHLNYTLCRTQEHELMDGLGALYAFTYNFKGIYHTLMFYSLKYTKPMSHLKPGTTYGVLPYLNWINTSPEPILLIGAFVYAPENALILSDHYNTLFNSII